MLHKQRISAWLKIYDSFCRKSSVLTPLSKGKLIVNCLPFELCDIRVFALQLFVGRFEEVVVVEPGEGFLYQFAEWRVEEQSVEGVQGHRTRRYCRFSLVAIR